MREWYNGSIVAFQAIDPGSTPGSRTFMLLQAVKWYWSIGQLFLYVDKLNLLPRNQMREWYNGSIVAFQAIDPGSTPGSRTFYATSSSKMILVNWSAVSLCWQVELTTA